ncbi:TPA: hypothetical protein N2D99_002187 [Clostridium botulinum]|nr:hypothetical protein [Clostridium botulinum]
MIEDIKNIFQKGRNKLEIYEKVLNNIENNPELIMKELYFEGKDDNLLTHIIYVEDNSKLVEFQRYIFSILIPYLKDFLSIDDIVLWYSDIDYPSNIVIKYKDMDIATINIYNKVFMKLENEQENTILSKINTIKEKIKELEIKNSELEVAKASPLILGGANPIKLADIALRKKKYLNKVNRDIISTSEEAFKLQSELQSLEIQLQGAKDSYVEVEYILERIERKLKNKFNYNILNKNSVEM